jgi:hypothetical protein
MSLHTVQLWQLWLEYLLAKAANDEITAAQKLNDLMETLQ